MGSSFAAGSGLRPRSPGSPRLAQRSAANYAHLVADRLGLDLTDVTCSGTTAASLLTASSRHPAPTDAVSAATRLVTITSGGNDVGYMSVLGLASLPRPLRALPPVKRRLEELMEGVDARFVELSTTWDGVLGTIRSRAPEATVVVVDYLTLLPPSGTPAPLGPDAAAWARSTARRLGVVTAAAAERTGCRLVAASAASREHHAWSMDPWTHRFRLGPDTVPYHPNHAGMRAIADLVLKELRGPVGSG
ncbi:hypothetical protein ASG73_00330 [Janibacter sp. Soil728]|nr:hypothetical protein ASG73_00330 [Janibacter sp. Soil728]